MWIPEWDKMEKVLYVDMDNVLVDFESGKKRRTKKEMEKYLENPEDVPGIFARMEPLPGATDSFKLLSKHFDTYILSTAPWKNGSAWSHKLEWVKEHLGIHGEKRLILCHHKNLLRGDYIIDDRIAHGVDKFVGKHIHFGKGKFLDWPAVVKYLLDENGITYNKEKRR
jgi:5'-nucleotidase